MAKKKKKDDIKNTLLKAASTAKNIAIKSNSDTFNNAKNVSVPRPTTTLSNATNKVLSTPKITPKSTVKKPTSTSAKTPTIKSSSLPTVSSNPKVQKMAENSTQWNRLEAQKNLLLKQNPNQNVSALTNKQNLLHKNNTDLGLDLGLKFAPSGSWTNSSGNKAYDVGTTNNGYISPVSPLALLTQLNSAMPKPALYKHEAEKAASVNKINQATQQSLKEAGQWLLHNTAAGAAGFASSITNTVDMVLPDRVTPSFLQSYFDHNRKTNEEWQQISGSTNSEGGTASEIAGTVYQAGVQAVPAALAAIASGGSSLASQLGQAGNAVSKLITSLPFWTSFAQTAGNEYFKALENGANELQASLTGMTSGAVGGAIERMGGIDTLLGNKAQGVLRTAAEEAGEEVLQDITSGLINKTAYDHEREWFGTGDSDAVINPQRLAMNAGAGAILGGAVSGVNTAINGRVNANNNTIANAKQSVNDIEVPTLKTVAENHINNTISDVNPIRVGKATTIQKPYDGKTPVASQQNLNRQSIHIDNNLLNNAQTIIDDAKQSQTFAKNIKTALKNIFQQSGGSRLVTVDNLYFDGKNYSVSIPARVFSKVASDHSMSSEKLAAFSKLDEIISTAQYVGSGHYNKNKNKAANVIRYDYFENLLDINNQNYIVTFDVEVFRDTNNFRTYRVINEIDLTPTAASRRSKTDGLTTAVSGLSDSIVSHNNNQNNTAMANGNTDVTPPTLRTVAENHINKNIANAKNTQNASMLSGQPLHNNTSVNVENMTSITPLQVPTLRTVAENHIAETIAQNTQNATNSQPSVQTQTVGQIIDNAIADAQNTKTTTNSNTAVDTQQDADVVNILSAWDTVREFDKQIADFENRVSFTQRDLKKIKAALLADDKSIVSTADNPQDALYMVELKSLRNNAYKPISDYNQANSSERNIQAMEWADYIAQYATDKNALSYFLETPERNIYDIFGKNNRHLAQQFIDTFLTPVHKDVAKRNKIANDYRSRVRNLKLDKHESAIVQYMIENELAGAKQYIADHKIKMTDKRTAKIDNAVTEFRAIYKEVLDKINTALIRNGYEPVQSLGDFYAPHFIEKLSDRKLARLAYWLKIKITKKDQLPTDLAGVTEMNRPGKKWSGNLEHRKGTKTIYDAVRGFDQYIETVSDVIALTDSIQRLRSLEDAVRYRLSDEGTQMEIDAVKNDIELNALQKREKIEGIYSQEQTHIEKIKQLLSQKDAGMRNFVTELRRYTDSLAGKKSRGDRGIEDIIGREVYEISKQVQNRITLDLLGANIASASTNFIPLTQATGEIEMPYLIKGMYDTLKNVAKDDGFIDASTFLTNRIGSKPINQSFGQKFINKSMWVMEAIDYLVSNTIVRAKTNQNIQNGMDLDSAIDEADSFAASLMADRSKGAMPAVFEIQNPLIKPFTMFQLEVNNQLRYLGKDIPRRLGEQGGQAIAAALTNIFFMSFIGNEVFEKLMGRRPAFDPAGIIKNAMNVYYDVSKNTSDKIEQITTPFVQQLPFVGGMLDGGRVPISAVFPKLPNLWEGFNSELAPEKRKDLIMTELSKPFFSFVLPVGGNAIKRGIEGFNMIRNGGEYRLNDNGEEQLMFAAPGDTPNDYLKAMLFGKYSNENGQNYINNGFQVLSPEYTQKYKKLISDEYGIDNNTAYDALMAVANAPSDEKRAVLMNTPLPSDAKSYLDWTLFSYADSGNRIDYSDKDHFNITTQIDSDFLDNALYLYDNLGLNADEVINIIKTSSFESINQVGSKKDQIFSILNNIYELNVSDDLKNYAYTEILAPQISEKFTTEQGKQLLEGVPMREAIRSYYMRDIINEEINNDNTIHPLDKKDYKTLGWQNYLAENALEENMTFEQREKLRYFLANGQSEFEKTWDDYVYGGNEKERENIEALRNCGLDTLTYQVIKSGISDFKADKDANGEPIDDSKKNKVSAYFKQWNLTDEQYALMMKLQGYKVGSSSSKKKSSSSKKSSGGSSSSTKVKGGFSDFKGF